MPLLNGTRTLTEDDSDGIYVRCSDESHQDWPVKDDIFRQALIIPFGRYFSLQDEDTNNLCSGFLLTF